MRSIAPRSAALTTEAGTVLTALATGPEQLGLRMNDLTQVTGLPTGHVGRHLRTLEADRLAAFAGGVWHLTLRGRRAALDAADPAGRLAA